MTRIQAIHFFGDDGQGGDREGATAQTIYAHRVPSLDEIIRALIGPRPVALALTGRIEPRRLAGIEVDAGMTLLADYAGAATGGRASPDLTIEALRAAPAVGILLVSHLLDVGPVVFGAGVRDPDVSRVGQSTDPLSEIVTAYAERGEVLSVLELGGESEVTCPPAPPALRPRASTNHALSRRIEQFNPDRSIARIASPPDAVAVKAGLWLWFDFLNESHRLSQSIEGQGRSGAGDYWHAIMHRREGDYGNSKYWFRRVGHSPVFAPLAERVPRAVADGGEVGAALRDRIAPNGKWAPMAFVDACEEAERSGDPRLDILLRRLQADEMLLLLLQTCRDAVGESGPARFPAEAGSAGSKS